MEKERGLWKVIGDRVGGTEDEDEDEVERS